MLHWCKCLKVCRSLFQVCKQLELINDSEKTKGPTSDTLRRAMGVAQHHDAVTGTSKQHVADDYAKRLAIGAAECQVFTTQMFLSCFTTMSSFFSFFVMHITCSPH